MTPIERSADERALMRRALRSVRGRYTAERASQLSGVPARTLYHWAQTQSLVPDWAGGTPLGWSYRDVVYARLLAWLRSKDMPLPAATQYVASIRGAMATASIDPHLHSDGRVVLAGSEQIDRLSGQAIFDGLVGYLDEFDIQVPIAEVSTKHLWGPDLLRPSAHTYLSPWVVGGEPCVDHTRIPTISIYALHRDRSLTPKQIVAMYPGLTIEAAEDALLLESKLHHEDVDAPAA